MNTLTRGMVLVTMGLVMAVGIFFINQHPGRFKVIFLDVGQGDAIFIQTPEKYQILIDTGASSVITTELGTVMAPWDRSIDMVIITHPDADHFGALDDVIASYRIGTIVDNGFYYDQEFVAYKTRVDKHDIEYVQPRNRYQVTLPGETTLTFLSVPAFGRGADKNDESIIVRIDYQEASFLLTGDASADIEEQLIEDSSDMLDVDVLKLGHHGSKTSTSEEFLKATTPQMGIVSAGAGNRYGHPHPDVTNRLTDLDILQWCTCERGRITFVWKDQGLVVR